MEKILKNQYEPVMINGLRVELKLILQREIDNLPNLLDQMPPKERIDAICRLMPFIFPKIEAINATDGEPTKWDI